MYLAWAWAYLRGWGNPERIGAGFGAIARRHRPLHDQQERRSTVEGRLVTTIWPSTLRVAALDAQTGRLHAFEATEGHLLADAVSASGAVPGISPAVELGGRLWIDGGMVSSANARLAAGYDRVLVLAPLPTSYGGVPSVSEDVAALREHARVDLAVPDRASRAAIGANIYDATRRAASADAGRHQGLRAADAIDWR